MIDRMTDEDGVVTFRFNSWGEFVEVAGTPSNCPQPSSRKARAQGGWYDDDGDGDGDNDESWAGGSFEHAIKLATEGGWKKGEELVKKYSSVIFEGISSRIDRPQWIYDIEGTQIDIPRYLDNEPECWLRQESNIQEGPGRRIVKIVSNGTVSAAVGTRTILNRGAAIASVCQLLEYAGFGTELVIVHAIDGYYSNTKYKTKSGKPRLEVIIPIKSADQPIDLPRTTYALAHNSSLRRLGFAVWEHSPRWFREAASIGNSGTYGMPCSSSEVGDIKLEKALYGDEDACDWNDPSAVNLWILEKLEEQGLVIREP